MITDTLKTARDVLCDRMMDLRQFPFVDSIIADADDQIILNLIEEHREGNEDAGNELITHAKNVIDHMYRAGHQEEDEVFLAEVALSEAVAAEIAAGFEI